MSTIQFSWLYRDLQEDILRKMLMVQKRWLSTNFEPKSVWKSSMRGTLEFSVLRFWLFFRSVFRFLCWKTSVFRFWCSLRFADFSFFSVWFSVFVENTSGFSVLLSNVLFGFSYFILFGFRFLLDLSGNWSRIECYLFIYLFIYLYAIHQQYENHMYNEDQV